MVKDRPSYRVPTVRYSKINVSNGVLTIERPCTSKSSLHIQQVPLKRS
jgi:hypothetical protein